MMLRITQAALPAIQLQHREANNCVIQFLSTLIAQGGDLPLEEGELGLEVAPYKQAVQAILDVCGQEMVNQMVCIRIMNNE